MGLSIRKKDAEPMEIPMSSMIDVVFLLLIYFVWTYEIDDPEAHLSVNLPGAPDIDVADTPPPPPLEVIVYKSDYVFRGKSVGLDRIQRALAITSGFDRDTTLIIKVIGEAPTKNLIELLDRCKEAGLTNLNVVPI